LTKPSDFSPLRALEIEQPQAANGSVSREVWTLRLLGAVLLITGWLAVVLHNPEPTHVIVDTAVLASLGVYGFVAAARSRRKAVALERKLRLELLVHNMELENMAMRDDLTQLFNRRYLFERLERELETAKGFGRHLSVIMIDLDCMKAVNDTYGHRTGDKVLAAFGRFLLDQTRASDVPARVGGDEFAVILPDTAQAAAETLSRRIEKRLESENLLEEEGAVIRLSASFGAASYPDCGDTVDALMLAADAAMYQCKQQHKVLDAETTGEDTSAVPPMFRAGGVEQPAPAKAPFPEARNS
jgi:diguanylate cyclase (GGDEF)-like protein